MSESPPRSAEPTTADLDARRAARRYPDRPIVAVLAVVLRGEEALIVQRAQQPNAGRWGFPGGVLELGETVADRAMRQLSDGTGITPKPAGILDVHDAITRDAAGRVQFHYLLIAVRGIWQSGEGEPADDAAARPRPETRSLTPRQAILPQGGDDGGGLG